MKRFLTILALAGVFLATGCSKERAGSDFTASAAIDGTGVVINQQEGRAVFSASNLSTDPGRPALPQSVMTFLLPADADPESVTVAVRDGAEVTVPGSFDVLPAKPATVDGTLVYPSDRRIVNGRDTDIYSRNAFYPSGNISFTVGRMRDYILVRAVITTARFNPVTGEIRKLSAGSLAVSCDRTGEQVRALPVLASRAASGGNSAAARIADLAVNYSGAITSYQSANSHDVAKSVAGTSAARYVIITTSAIANASAELRNFIASKQARGFTVKLVTESEWGGGTGDAAAERIRGWLRSNYAALGTEYCLLIGNPDPARGDVPMKLAMPRESAEYYRDAPTDYYYADLSGNWDIDGDGAFAEETDDYGKVGGPDIYAEISVGRIPYYGSIADLDSILAKSIAYENETDTAWRRKALLPMEPLDASTPAYHCGENIKDRVLIPNGWAYHRLYDAVEGAPAAESVPCNYSTVLSAWQGGRYGLVVWMTHGWYGGGSDVMDIQNAALLTDDNAAHPSFTYHGSCSNAEPEYDNNIAYTLLKRGAVTTVAATRVSWYWVGQTDFTHTTSIGGYGYKYAYNLIQNKLSAGDALALAKAELDTSVIWMNNLVMVTYGDPSLVLDPSTATEPELTVSSSNLTIGDMRGETQRTVSVNCYNAGGGDLVISDATSSAAWLKPVVRGRSVFITVDTTGLIPNAYYPATVCITSNGGACDVAVSFYLYEPFRSRIGVQKLYLAGADFGGWASNEAKYQFTLIGDYVWEAKVRVSESLRNAQYKITDGSWDVNWGGGASGRTAVLARNGANAVVNLGAGQHTVQIHEGATADDPLNVFWFGSNNALTVHFREWRSAAYYVMHTWGTSNTDYTMNYEGWFNNGHWWTVHIDYPADDFFFTFRTSDNKWEGSAAYDRRAVGEVGDIYVKPFDSKIYYTRP